MSPSLDCDTPLDTYIKTNLIVDTLNLACINENTSKSMKKKLSTIGRHQKKSGLNHVLL
jgi:hypothetical protein